MVKKKVFHQPLVSYQTGRWKNTQENTSNCRHALERTDLVLNEIPGCLKLVLRKRKVTKSEVHLMG